MGDVFLSVHLEVIPHLIILVSNVVMVTFGMEVNAKNLVLKVNILILQPTNVSALQVPTGQEKFVFLAPAADNIEMRLPLVNAQLALDGMDLDVRNLTYA